MGDKHALSHEDSRVIRSILGDSNFSAQLYEIRKNVTDPLMRAAQPIRAVTQAALDPLKRTALDPLKNLTEAEVKKVEALLRERFGGYDASNSASSRRAAMLAKYRQLFQRLDPNHTGSLPINDLEDLFGTAQLYEARTEVGQLSYEVDVDGNGSLTFMEFCEVMDKLGSYHTQKAYGRVGPASGGSFMFGTDGAEMTLKDIIWHTVDDPSFSRLSRVIGFVLLTAIALAVIVFVMQTETATEAAHAQLFTSLESWCVAVFTAEYIARVLTCPNRKKFLLSLSNLIDLFTIIPYYMDALYETVKNEQSGSALRAMRVFRVFRIFKIFKYVPYVSLMTQSAAASAAPICMALFVMLIGMVLLAFAAYFTERGQWDPVRSQYVTPEGTLSPFQSIGEASYWAVITLSTVGYGDLYPVTNNGKLVGALTALAGTVIVSFPVSIYTEEFSKEYSEMVKTKSLQAELGGDDLCLRLIAAHDASREGPDLKRFPATASLSSNLSQSVPHNLALMRRARLRAIQRLGDLVDNMARAAVEADAAAVGTGSSLSKPSTDSDSDRVDAADSKMFHDVWTMQLAQAQQIESVDEAMRAWAKFEKLADPNSSASEEEDGAPIHRADSEQSAAFRSIYAKIRSKHQLEHQAQEDSKGARGTGLRSTVDSERSADSTGEEQRIHGDPSTAATLNTLRTMFGEADTHLTSRSFRDYDLADDEKVEEAILKLLSDTRKHVWAQARILESRFRDDICIELSRRWKSWMSMPREYVREVAEGYVFRKRDLRRGLGYNRLDLATGMAAAVHHRPEKPPSRALTELSSSDRNGLETPQRRGLRPRSDSTRNMSLRNLLAAPSASAVMNHVRDKAVEAGQMAVGVTKLAADKMKEGVTQSVSRMREGVDKVKEEMQHALDPLGDREPKDYQARIREQYSDVLGAEVKKKKKIYQQQHHKVGAAGKQRVGGNAFETIAEEGESPADGDGSMVQTAFGVSSVMPHMPVISSSMATGMASIAAARSLSSPPVTGYYSYFSRINAAPLKGDDGELIPTGYNVPSVDSVLASTGSDPTSPKLTRAKSSLNVKAEGAGADSKGGPDSKGSS